MFSYKNKLDSNLNYFLKNKSYKKYRVLIKCKSLQEGIEKKIKSYKGTLIFSLKYCSLICAMLNASSIYRLAEYPEVSYIAFDEYLFLCGISVSTANQISNSYKSSFSGKGVHIGVIDSGVYPHADILNPNNKIESFIDLINEYKYPYDDNGHGSATCGIIAGSGISSNYMYKGIAPLSKLSCYKAFNKLGRGYVSTVLFALESLIDENKVKLICLPCELLTHNYFIMNLFNDIFSIAVEKNITIFLPSGSNYNSENSIMGISTLKNCITVGGIDNTNMKIYDYSSCGPYCNYQKPDLCASCVNITSLNSNTSFISEKDGIKLYPKKLNSQYKSFSGTSLAAAFVCGISALLLESNPDLTFNDIYSILKLSCEQLELDKNKQGNGIINFDKLLLKK